MLFILPQIFGEVIENKSQMKKTYFFGDLTSYFLK